VIFAPALRYLQKEFHPPGLRHRGLAYWRYAYDRNGAPLLDELAAVIDHVKPFSGGGPGEASNLATACNKCNTKKNNSDPARWVKDHPIVQIKAKHGEPTNWDGFSTVFLSLAEKYSDELASSERDWLKVLKARSSEAPSQPAKLT
jgi:HNH endonuclease